MSHFFDFLSIWGNLGGLTEKQAVWLLVAVFGMYHYAQGGCSGKCCQGSDLTCSSVDWRIDRVYGICYCDEICARVKDCCFDYSTECLAQPCVVSEWTHWSGCARSCRPSFRVRSRSVERPAQKSGQPCPALEQRAGCMEYQDRQGRPCAHTQGPALITALEFSKGRAAHSSPGSPLDLGFCVEFKVESLTAQCMAEKRLHTRWMQYLREGFVVCVACQPPAISNHSRGCQGDGATADRAEVTRWQAVGLPQCSGTWRRVQRLPRCSCPQVHSFIFI
ncbi:somatomedin-B and thrombospondin type-1 domain-containing protein isoform X2 [Brachyhypopomus gauderio]|uniref:somatomedin-B and thrombospondin type-1 domain-containing protein isoform X2 n=1 Tax=Brachyhypopomus gauderio TaxID=698409 RepID=UPI0040429AFA